MFKILRGNIFYILRLANGQSTTSSLLPATDTLSMIRHSCSLRPNNVQRMTKILLQQARQLGVKLTMLHEFLRDTKILDQQRQPKS